MLGVVLVWQVRWPDIRTGGGASGDPDRLRKIGSKDMTSINKVRIGYKRILPAIFNSFAANNIVFDTMHFKYAKWKIGRLEGMAPQNFIIETTNHCNAKCVMCGHRSMMRKKGFMNDEIFYRVTRSAAQAGIRAVTLQGFGEPLLDKKIYKRIRLLKSLDMTVTFNTNASLLDENSARLLVESGLDGIFISIDSFTAETFEKIRPPLSFDRVIGNILKFLDVRSSLRSKTPYLTLTYVVLDSNEEEVLFFHRYWSGLADNLIVAYARNWAGQLPVESSKSPHTRNTHRMELNPCDYLWNSLYVLCDGRAALCCDDFEGSVILGDLNTQSVDEVWRGSEIRKYREAHFEGRRRSMPLCRGCSRHINWFKVKSGAI